MFYIELNVVRYVEESSKKVNKWFKIVVVGDMELLLLVFFIINVLEFIRGVKSFDNR